MWFDDWFRSARLARSDRSPARGRPRARPRLEALEDRLTPSGGALDTTFGSGGAVTLTPPAGSISAYNTPVAVQADGKVLALRGNTSSAGDQLALTRLNVDGSPDTTFGTGGTAYLPVAGKSDAPKDVVLQPDGKILVAATVFAKSSNKSGLSDPEYAVARLNANGTMDTSFGGAHTGWWLANPSSRDESLSRLMVVPSGSSFSIYAAGTSVLANGNYSAVVVKLSTAGVPVTSFGSGGYAIRDLGNSNGLSPAATGLAVTPSGRVIEAAMTPISPGTSLGTGALVAFNAAGQADTSFNGTGLTILAVPTGASYVTITALVAEGESVVTAGYAGYTGAPGMATQAATLMRYTASGALDSTFATGGVYVGPHVAGSLVTHFTDMRLAADGSIVTAGYGEQKDTSGTLHFGLLLGHFSADGLADANFGPTPDGSGLVIRYDQPPGSLVGRGVTLAIDPLSGDLVTGSGLNNPERGYVLRFTGP